MIGAVFFVGVLIGAAFGFVVMWVAGRTWRRELENRVNEVEACLDRVSSLAIRSLDAGPLATQINDEIATMREGRSLPGGLHRG